MPPALLTIPRTSNFSMACSKVGLLSMVSTTTGHLGMVLAQERQHAQAVAMIGAGHHKIGDQHIVVACVEFLHQLPHTGCLADKYDIGMGIEGELNRQQDDRMVVCREHTN